MRYFGWTNCSCFSHHYKVMKSSS